MTTLKNVTLPNFPGFYNNLDYFMCNQDYINEYYLDNNPKASEKEIEKNYDDIFNKYDFTKAKNDIVKLFFDFSKNYLPNWIKLSSPKLDSPAFYNYSNDVILCNAKLNEVEFFIWYKSIKNTFQFKTFLKEKCTSYDGFSSFFSNNPNDIDWKNPLEKDDARLDLLLEFYVNSQEQDDDFYLEISQEFNDYDYYN